ncbi:hypothetical protein OUY22_18240 [Nonomuraea sp. MCN248]|uniref:Glycosyltransferase RgtA/B/C/D-like domain-containing protein n=1 Tax=Nonomuraea corallina TaxID=2989783 RepID=A0ABT4SEK0_9ACTN|nr:hypothetical protein [Nonomuraea corallina]MDA0635366.1 hypothetical protein [Nonomuraea corallina]
MDPTRRPPAGRVLAVVSVLPALAVAGWLLVALPLLALGVYRPAIAVPLGLAAAALLCLAGTRGPVKAVEAVEATAGQVAAVAAVALGSGLFNAVMHGEQLAVRRDPSTYAQYAIWLAREGFLPIPTQVAAFGGPDPSLVFESVGFYAYDGAVVPQFMPGAPLLFASGEWAGGLFLTPAVLGALAVLTLAGLTARLAGGRWAAVAAVAFACCLPILYTSRTTFSEIASALLLLGGLALVYDALYGQGRRLGAALGGLTLGLAVLVRVDALRDVLPVLAFAGVLVAMGRRSPGRPGELGAPLLAGLAAGAGLGLAAGFGLSRPYLTYLSSSLRPLLLICAAVVVLTLAGTAAAPLLARVRPPRWLPAAGAALVVLVVAALAVRPWVQTVRRVPDNDEDRLTATFIEQIQRANGLPADGTRLYFENTLHWLAWYVGVPALVLATLAAAVLTHRLLRGRALPWLLPLLVIGWATLATLLRPAITPDHPWAARRLVPLVIPGVILLAVWGAERLRRRVAKGTRPARWVVPACALLLVAPPAVISIGTAFTPVGRGEAAAVAAMCARIPRDASVLVVERVTGDRFTQVVRGTCGVPTAQVKREDGDTAPGRDVRRLIERVRAAGRVPVVLAAEESQVSPYGPATWLIGLSTRQDERSLTEPPDGTWSLRINVWMALP